MWILMRETEKHRDAERPNHRDRALRLSPTISGRAAATLHDPDASSHRSDQGHSVTDVCPGSLFQAWVLLAHTPKKRVEKSKKGGNGVGTEEKKDGVKKERRKKRQERKRKNGGRGGPGAEFALGNQTSRHTDFISGTRSTLSCFWQTATSLVRKWHYKFRHTSSRDSLPDWPGGGTRDLTCTLSSLVCFFKSVQHHWREGTRTLNNKLLHEKHTSPVSEPTVKRLIQLKKRVFRSHWCLYTKLNMTSAQWLSHSTFALRSNTQKKEMRREKKGANYSLTAGWPETNLIIIIVKKAQRKPAASPLPPQSNREAFSLRNDLQSDKSNRFTVTAWKGPARTLSLLTWPDLLALRPFPFPLPPPLSRAPSPACSRGQRRMRLAQ